MLKLWGFRISRQLLRVPITSILQHKKMAYNSFIFNIKIEFKIGSFCTDTYISIFYNVKIGTK